MRYLNVVALAGLLLMNAVSAAEMNIKPGKWEFHSTTSMLMPGAPRETVNQRCIDTPSMTPEMLMTGMDRGCQLTDAGTTADSMAWAVECSSDGGTSTGKGHVEKNSEDTLSGAMTMTISYKGQENTFDMRWNGTYIGPCD